MKLTKAERREQRKKPTMAVSGRNIKKMVQQIAGRRGIDVPKTR